MSHRDQLETNGVGFEGRAQYPGELHVCLLFLTSAIENREAKIRFASRAISRARVQLRVWGQVAA